MLRVLRSKQTYGLSIEEVGGLKSSYLEALQQPARLQDNLDHRAFVFVDVLK